MFDWVESSRSDLLGNPERFLISFYCLEGSRDLMRCPDRFILLFYSFILLALGAL